MNPISLIRGSYVRRRKSERGMTLIELIVAMTIGGILITLIFQFFNTQAQSFLQSRDTAEMQQELRWALQFMSDHVKLAGNGVPPRSIDTTGFQVIENADGPSGAPDSLSIVGSFRSLVITIDQNMGNEGSQIKCSDKGNVPPQALESLFELGDLAVISDGTFTEVFQITTVQADHLWHNEAPPWNDDNKLDHRYTAGSTIMSVTHYSFFVAADESGHPNLMVKTQAYPPQILAGDVDQFQIRFKMKSGAFQNDIAANEVEDIRQVEITIRARTPKPIPGYRDPVFGDGYKRLELKITVIPKNLVKNI